jgi:hypothetical protein
MKYILVLLTICFATKAFSQTDEEQIKATINRLFEGLNKSDTAKMRSTFSSGAQLQSVLKNKEGKVRIMIETIDSFMASIARPRKEVLEERIKFEMIKIDGDMASVWTPYGFFIDGKLSHCGVDSYQLAKIDGQWKIIFLVDTRRRQNCEGW